MSGNIPLHNLNSGYDKSLERKMLKIFGKILLLIVVFNIFNSSLMFGSSSKKTSKESFFIENKGQWNPEVKFLSSLPGCNIWVTDNDIVFDYFQNECNPEPKCYTRTNHDYNFKDKRRNHQRREVLSQVIKMQFSNSNFNSDRINISGINKLSSYYNYFIGIDKSKWATNVSHFKEVKFYNLYDGIDMRLYFQQNQFRYDFIVHPGANISEIKINFEGADSIWLNNGKLLLSTVFGTIEHKDLFSYQLVQNQKKEILTKIQFKNQLLTFEAKHYDKNCDLIIDPLVFSTYLHGYRVDHPNSITHDINNNIYITGRTASKDYPVTEYAYKTKYGYTFTKSYAFFSVLSPDGSKLIYSSYFGSDSASGGTVSQKIIVRNNTINLIGITQSYDTTFDDFPTTANAYQKKLKGLSHGNNNVFITQFDITGTKIINSTLFGCDTNVNSPGVFELFDSFIDNDGFSYIYGYIKPADSNFIDFPITSKAYQKKISGLSDLFITKFKPDLSGIVFSSYLGGSGWDSPRSMLIDKDKNIFITGATQSKDFPISVNAYQKKINTNIDYPVSGFISKLDSNCEKLLFSTYFGNPDKGMSINKIKLDTEGNPYVSGFTSQKDFPTTPNAYQRKYLGSTMIFVSKFNKDCSALINSTLLGGRWDSNCHDMILDSLNNVFLIGNTWTDDFPLTNDAIQTKNNGTNLDVGALGDAIICKFNPDLSKLLFSTYFGGTAWEEGSLIDIDEAGSVIIAGATNSLDFPTTPNAFEPLGNKNYEYVDGDVFVAKFDIVTDVNENTGKSYLTSWLKPNPVNDFLLINTDKFKKIEIFTTLGIKVLETEWKDRLDVSALPAGVYFVRLGGWMGKFVKIGN